jgi:hypothetical protein
MLRCGRASRRIARRITLAAATSESPIGPGSCLAGAAGFDEPRDLAQRLTSKLSP